MEHPSAYNERHIVILGLARSGCAVAKLFQRYGARVTVNDRKPRAECPEAEQLESLGIRVICGHHPEDLIGPEVALVIKNPGIPYTIHPLKKAAALGIETVTEVEVAWHITDVPIIGITGSNGKTTTTSWVNEMLEAAGLKPAVAGNIGRALCEVVTEESTDYEWLVTELSSFQLKGTMHFRPKIACLLNFSETHLDYHGSMDDYFASKLRLFQNQTKDDTAVLNYDDPACRKLAESLQANVAFFSMKEAVDFGAFVADGMIVWRDIEGGEHLVASVRELSIPGSFNAENALAATVVSLLAGAPIEAVAHALRTFRGVPHRLELVAELHGVKYYNNSKATNAEAASKALEAIDEPVVLIAGGLDRGSQYEELVPVFRKRVKALIVIGETREKLKAIGELAGVSDIITIDAGNAEAALAQAVERAAELASDGDAVMLNPACASWDMFPSFEERGRMFNVSVHNLK